MKPVEREGMELKAQRAPAVVKGTGGWWGRVFTATAVRNPEKEGGLADDTGEGSWGFGREKVPESHPMVSISSVIGEENRASRLEEGNGIEKDGGPVT